MAIERPAAATTLQSSYETVGASAQQRPLAACASPSSAQPRSAFDPTTAMRINVPMKSPDAEDDEANYDVAASLLGHPTSPVKCSTGHGPLTPFSSPSKSNASGSISGSPSKQSNHSPRAKPVEPVYITSKDFGPCAEEPEAAEDVPEPTVAKEATAKRSDRKSKIDAISAMSGQEATGHRPPAEASATSAGRPSPANHPTRRALLEKPAPPLRFDHSTFDPTQSAEDAGIPTGRSTPRHAPKRLRPRLFNLPEAKTYYPTPEEFSDPMRYIQSIGREGSRYGIIKIVPPEGWNPECVLDEESFRFRTRVQQLNELTADARASENFLEQLDKFHAQQGLRRVTIPVIDRRPVNLYDLKLTVASLGGYDSVCRQRKWTEVTRRIGYNERDCSHLSTQVKAAFSRIIHPYEEFLLKAKEQVRLTQSSLSPALSQSASMASVHGAIHASSSHGPDGHRATDRSTSPGPSGENVSGGSPAKSLELHSSHTAELLASENLDDTAGTSLDGPAKGNRRSSRKRGDASSSAKNLETPTSGRRRKASSPPTTNGASSSSKEKAVVVLPGAEEQMCEICFRGEDGTRMLLCDECNRGYHTYCLQPPLTAVPTSSWYCPSCLIGVGRDYGFHDGDTHSLYTFWQRAEAFKRAWWSGHPDRIWTPESAESDEDMTDVDEEAKDGSQGRTRTNGLARRISGTDLIASEDDVEREFWRLVHSRDEVVEVEYGADVHSTTRGSALPTPETHPLSPHSKDRWNLNNLPILPESLLQYIKSDISGMTVPWIYVGMMFSTFCWHNEDHFTYSINYQHWGETKTWYGVPGDDAEKFEAAMRKAAPDLFEATPDLLFHLTTMMSPEKLRAEGVRVYACDQRANEFVITFPKAYHSGFNQGLNLNEAVNFALPDWIDYGLESTERYRLFRKGPVFSHDQLLITVSQQNESLATAQWLQHSLKEMVERETRKRDALRQVVPELSESLVEDDIDEKEYSCCHCQAFCYLSQIISDNAEGPACPDHGFEVCKADPPSRWTLRKRFTDDQLRANYEAVAQRAALPRKWEERVKSTLMQNTQPSLKVLKSLLAEGDKLQYPMKSLENLRRFVEEATAWTERANVFLIRKHHKRRHEGASSAGAVAPSRPRRSLAAATSEETPSSRRGVEASNDDLATEAGVDRSSQAMFSLLSELDMLRFDSPEIAGLQTLVSELQAFQAKADDILARSGREESEMPSLKECEEVLTLGASLNVDAPQVDELSRFVDRRKWIDHVEEARDLYLYRHEVQELLDKADACGLTEHKLRKELEERLAAGKEWTDRACELLDGNKLMSLQELEDLSEASGEGAAEFEVAQRLQGALGKGKELQQKLRALYNDTVVEPASGPDDEGAARPSEEAFRLLLAEARRILRASKTNRLSLDLADEIQNAVVLFDVWKGDLHSDVVSIFAPHRRLGDIEKRAELDKLSEKVLTATEPDDDDDDAASRHCVCRTKAQPPTPSNATATCRDCQVIYHLSCLKIKQAEAARMGDQWSCPACDFEALEALLKVRKSVAIGKISALIDSAKYASDKLRFPPPEVGIVRTMVQRASKLQEQARGFIASKPTYRDPAVALRARHLCRKLLGCPIEVYLADGDSALEMLAGDMAIHMGPTEDQHASAARSPPTVAAAADPRVAAAAAAETERSRMSATVAMPNHGPAATLFSKAAIRAAALDDMSIDLGTDEAMPEVAEVGPMVVNGAQRRERNGFSNELPGQLLDGHSNRAPGASPSKDDKKRKRGKRAKLVFREEIGIRAHRNGQPIYCLCHQPERARMIACDKCLLWFHTDCVGLGDPPVWEGDTWNCPMCCIKAERKYPQAEVRVRDIGVTDPYQFIDVRATLRSTEKPVSKNQPWPAAGYGHYTRIILHLESFQPAVHADEARPDPVKRSRFHSETPAKPRRGMGSSDPSATPPVAGVVSSSSQHTPLGSTVVATGGTEPSPALGTEATKDDRRIGPSYPASSVSPKDVAAPVSAPPASVRIDGPQPNSYDQKWTPIHAPMTPAELHEAMRQRQLEGRKQLYLRGVSDAMLERYYIAFNGCTLIHAYRDPYGGVVEVPLSEVIRLDYDDPDGSRLIRSALQRFHYGGPPRHAALYPPSSGHRTADLFYDRAYRSEGYRYGAAAPAPSMHEGRHAYQHHPERTHSESAIGHRGPSSSHDTREMPPPAGMATASSSVPLSMRANGISSSPGPGPASAQPTPPSLSDALPLPSSSSATARASSSSSSPLVPERDPIRPSGSGNDATVATNGHARSERPAFVHEHALHPGPREPGVQADAASRSLPAKAARTQETSPQVHRPAVAARTMAIETAVPATGSPNLTAVSSMPAVPRSTPVEEAVAASAGPAAPANVTSEPLAAKAQASAASAQNKDTSEYRTARAMAQRMRPSASEADIEDMVRSFLSSSSSSS